MSDKVSIVMPVYNVEKYIERAIKSVLNQSYVDLEFIIVNDRTRDNSMEIAYKYAEIDKRIKIVNKEKNEGLGYARNTGMDLATGRYIYFIDSDDYIEENTIEKCIKKAKENNSDVVIFGYSEDFEENNEVTNRNIFTYEDVVINKQQFEKQFVELFNKTIIHSTCNKFYRLDLLKVNNIRFKKVSMCEDTFFNLELVNKLNNITILSDVLYHYMKRDVETLIVRYNPERFKFMNEVHESVINIMTEFNVMNKENMATVNKTYIRTVIFCIIQMFNENVMLSYKEKKSKISEICKNDTVKKAIVNIKNPSKVETVYSNMIRNKNILGIYCCSKCGNILKNKLNLLYKIVK